MSNCHSAQADYSDHDFMGGICKDCGEVSKRDVKALADQAGILEVKVTELVERNRRPANQIAGYGDRMQDTIGGIIREAKAEALREAADEVERLLTIGQTPSGQITSEQRAEYWAYSDTAAHIWIRTRADKIEAP